LNGSVPGGFGDHFVTLTGFSAVYMRSKVCEHLVPDVLGYRIPGEDRKEFVDAYSRHFMMYGLPKSKGD
jgi:hypothetical protein